MHIFIGLEEQPRRKPSRQIHIYFERKSAKSSRCRSYVMSRDAGTSVTTSTTKRSIFMMLRSVPCVHWLNKTITTIINVFWSDSSETKSKFIVQIT